MTPRIDLAGMALRVLEHALARAAQGPIEPGDGVRLALAVLVRLKVAQDWQARDFWKLLRQEDIAGSCAINGFPRQTVLTGFLDTWHYAAGRQPPDIAVRARKAGTVGPAAA